MAKTTMSATVDIEVDDKINKMAKKEERSYSHIANRLLKSALAALEEKPKK